MASDWIMHVKKVSKEKKIPYKEAMSVAKASYKGAKKPSAKKEVVVKEKKK